MDRRLALALLLSGLAVVVSSMLFPPAPRRTPPPIAAVDSSRAAPVAATPIQQPVAQPASSSNAPIADTLTVETQRAVYQFSTLGATPVGVRLRDYKALNRDSGSVQLVRDSLPLFTFQLVSDGDTIP